MGLTTLDVEVANPASPSHGEAVNGLIDSGAVYSVVPGDVLRRLGIAAHTRQRFRLADGRTIERERGDALYRYAGAQGAAPVIFGEPGDATLIGVVTLESLGFAIDVIRHDLVPLPMVLGGALRP